MLSYMHFADRNANKFLFLNHLGLVVLLSTYLANSPAGAFLRAVISAWI